MEILKAPLIKSSANSYVSASFRSPLINDPLVDELVNSEFLEGHETVIPNTLDHFLLDSLPINKSEIKSIILVF